MSFIFMDESGCLGFDFTKTKTKTKTSRNFIVTFLMVANDNIVNKAVTKTFKSIPSNKRKKHSGMLHCNKEDNKTRIKLLSELCDKDISIMVIRLNKEKVFSRLQDEKTILYNYVVNILLERIINKKLLPLDDTVNFIASRRETNKFLNENFRNYLQTQTSANNKLKLSIKVSTPYSVKGLQAVDFVSWAMFKKYEHREEFFYNIIKNLVVEEADLFG